MTEALTQKSRSSGKSERCLSCTQRQTWVFGAPQGTEGAPTSVADTLPSVSRYWFDRYGRTQRQGKTFQLGSWTKWSLFGLTHCVTKTFWMECHTQHCICISIWADIKDTCQVNVYIPDQIPYPRDLINLLTWNETKPPEKEVLSSLTCAKRHLLRLPDEL